MYFEIKVRNNNHLEQSLVVSRETIGGIDCITICFPQEILDYRSREVSVNKNDFINYLNVLNNTKDITTSKVYIPLEQDSFNTYCDQISLTLKIDQPGSDGILLILSDTNVCYTANIHELAELTNVL